MNPKFLWLFIIATVGLCVFGALQSMHMLPIGGVQANFILVFLVISAFFIKHLEWYSVLVILGAIGIRFSPGFSLEPIALVVVAYLVFFIKRKAVSTSMGGGMALVFCAMIVFYLIVEPRFIFTQISIFGAEALYNIGVAIILFESMSLVAQTRRMV